MDANTILGNRFAHSVVLTVVAVLAGFRIGDGVLVENIYLFAALTPVATWMMGRQFERAIVLGAGLVDEDELDEAERRSQSGYFW